VGALRLAAVAAGAPLVQDVVVTGLDREEVGLLVFLNPLAVRGLDPDAVRAHLEASFRAHNAAHAAGSQRVGRLLVLTEPPSIDANEITDKGYINQRAVLDRRAALVERLYSERDPEAIRL
jgi:feruloyl-CoA synthase